MISAFVFDITNVYKMLFLRSIFFGLKILNFSSRLSSIPVLAAFDSLIHPKINKYSTDILSIYT